MQIECIIVGTLGKAVNTITLHSIIYIVEYINIEWRCKLCLGLIKAKSVTIVRRQGNNELRRDTQMSSPVSVKFHKNETNAGILLCIHKAVWWMGCKGSHLLLFSVESDPTSERPNHLRINVKGFHAAVRATACGVTWSSMSSISLKGFKRFLNMYWEKKAK